MAACHMERLSTKQPLVCQSFDLHTRNAVACKGEFSLLKAFRTSKVGNRGGRGVTFEIYILNIINVLRTFLMGNDLRHFAPERT